MSRFGEIDTDATHAKNNNLSATTAPAVGDDSDDGYEVGSIWIDTTSGDSYICVDSSVGAAVWKATSPKGGGKSMILAFASGTDSNVSTNSIGYSLMAKFTYAGSDTVGSLTAIKVNAWKDTAGEANGEIRIIDATNGDAVIAELTGITSTDEDDVLGLGTISNLPTSAATFELQMGRSAGANRTIFCASIELEY